MLNFLTPFSVSLTLLLVLHFQDFAVLKVIAGIDREASGDCP